MIVKKQNVYVCGHEKEVAIIGNHIAELDRCPHCNKITELWIGSWGLDWTWIKWVDEEQTDNYACMWCGGDLPDRDIVRNMRDPMNFVPDHIKNYSKEKIYIEDIVLLITRCENCSDIINIYSCKQEDYDPYDPLYISYDEDYEQEIWTVDFRGSWRDCDKVWCKGCGIEILVNEYVAMIKAGEQ